MKLNIRRQLTCLVCCSLISAQAYGQSASFLNNMTFDRASGAEFISGNQPGTVLMKVNLWGGVNRPGIHHVPVKTDLMSLMSYAGGPTHRANLDDVTIKRDMGNKQEVIEVDVEELLTGASHHHVELAPNDIIVVPESQPLVSQDTVAVIGIISVVISAAIAISVIDRNNRIAN